MRRCLLLPSFLLALLALLAPFPAAIAEAQKPDAPEVLEEPTPPIIAPLGEEDSANVVTVVPVIEEDTPSTTTTTTITETTTTTTTADAPTAGAAAAAATADGAPVEERAPTHFLLEVDLGANLTSPGVATSAAFGAGGSPFGWPVIFYFIGKVGQIAASGSGAFVDTGNYSDSRSYLDLSVGVRSYVRLYGPLRLFAEATVGAVSATATLERDGFTPTESDGVYFAVGLAAGFQVRILHELSLGARVATLFTDDGLHGFRDALGIATPTPVLVQGSATWHF